METPVYRYNLNLLEQTLTCALNEANRFGYQLHYAVKANSNPKILRHIANRGFGADCVSGNEIDAAISAGFGAHTIVFAGVGKTNYEIEFAIDKGIRCLHVESLEELLVVNEISLSKNARTRIALRLNPNIDAGTHRYITTGVGTNKFGLSTLELFEAIGCLPKLMGAEFVGFHVHIGSQITDSKRFEQLAHFTNEVYRKYSYLNISYMNLGGGLGIDYETPGLNSIPNFREYFETFASILNLPKHIEVHFEPGRSIVGQCGDLLTKVLYIKQSEERLFAVVDAGMNNLIRPALYQAKHSIEHFNTNGNEYQEYDVVGPVCESSDTFAQGVHLPKLQRGAILVIRSAGAYGESMSSQYNLRSGISAVFEGSEVAACNT